MLRFIRKFQLPILVIGGSLLMVVFLLQPVLTRLSPSTLKTKVAKLDDGTTYTRGDQMEATVALNLLKRVHPRALGPRIAGGMGLDPVSETNRELHWLMLVKQADKAGLIGEAGDGVSWINELASREANIQARTEAQQGLIRSAPEFNQRIAELTPQIAGIMERNARLSAGNAGGTMESVYTILAQARGVYRLLSSIQTLPVFSDLNAIHAAHETLDSVAVNAVILDSSLVSSSLPEPTEEQLQAFFDIYKAQSASDNDFQIGYTQPTRIQLGWLTLDKNIFMNAVEADRVELHKIWLQNRDQYPGDFGLERINLERKFRDEQATKMMVEADRIIRAQILAVTNALPKSNGILTLPEDWEAKRPHIENISETVVERINKQFSISLPTPALTMIGDRWLNANDISSLPGFGSSNYRIGSRQLPAYALTQFFELDEANTTGLDVQVGLPLADPAATDTIGNRYYAVVLNVREQGPAEMIADATREQVIADYKAVAGYNLLVAQLDEIKASIAGVSELDTPLAPAIDMAMAMGSEDAITLRPTVLKNILVRRDSIDGGALTRFVDPRINTEDFRNAVLEAASGLPPLTAPDALAANPIPVAVALPSARSIAVSLVVAPRPVTSEQFFVLASSVANSARQRELTEASVDLDDPFSFVALSSRYGLINLKKEKEDKAEAEQAEAETESAEG